MKQLTTAFKNFFSLKGFNAYNFVFITVLFLSTGCGAQTVKMDAKGNYVAVKDTTKASSAKPTGKTYTDTKGNVYPVMVSVNGKLFVVRTSKTGNQYNQYLKL